MGNQLYCCSSYYQILVSLMKALTQGVKIDLVLEEHGVETAKQLKMGMEDVTNPMLRECIGKIFVCSNSKKVDPYVQRSASFLPWQRHEILRHMNRVFEGIDVCSSDQYEKIHVFWDLGYAGTYFNIKKKHYILHEDSLNSYQHIKGNRPHYAYLYSKNRFVFGMKKYLHTGVIPFGYSDCCDEVEVNEKRGIEIPLDKVNEVSRISLENSLTEGQKQAIFCFFTSGSPLNLSKGNESVLILTEPFAITDRLPDEAAQVRLYADVIKTYAKDCQVLIKAHPRDCVPYEKYFPTVTVLEKNIPMEILNFNKDFKVKRAVTVTSSVIQNLKCTSEKKYLGPEYLHKFTER